MTLLNRFIYLAEGEKCKITCLYQSQKNDKIRYPALFVIYKLHKINIHKYYYNHQQKGQTRLFKKLF